MEYSVGSLADLISGSNTPNKVRVIQKEFKKEMHALHKAKNKKRKVIKPVKKNKENTTTITKESISQESHGNKEKPLKKISKKLKVGNIKKYKLNITQVHNKKKLKSIDTNIEDTTSANIKRSKPKRKVKTSNSQNVHSAEVSTSKKRKRNQDAEKLINNKEKNKTEVLATTVFVGNITQVHNKQKLKTTFDSNIEDVSSENIKRKKMKRKLETSNGQSVHGDETSPKKQKRNHGDETSPKKQKRRNHITEEQINNKEKNKSIFEKAHGDETSPKKQKRNHIAEKQVNNKEKNKSIVEKAEVLARTIFVGNIPIKINKKKIKKYFKKYGEIESLRIRGIPVADPKTPKKVAAIKKEFNPKRSSVYCFIRFVNQEDALMAEAENGALFEEHHLRVHCCGSKDKPDETKAIFVGNISFEAEEDELWKLFEPCGPISYVRLVRDSQTGMGKGFGYVNFEDSDSVQLALEMENVKLRNRELRISLCNLNGAKKKKDNKNKKNQVPGKQKQRQNSVGESNMEMSAESKRKEKGDSTFKNDADNQESVEYEGKVKGAFTAFHGTKFSDKKKKRKVNKGLLQKKKMMKKIAPKPKT